MSEKNVLAGRYELIEKIGDGGMAIVYKAKDRLLKRHIAVKILKPEFVKDVKFIENFRRESHAAASLSNPNIVSIYDVGQEGSINYIVMELVTGEPLSEKIRKEGPLDYRVAMNIAKQIAHGLSAAHRKGIIHRDVKPHNILMTEDGIAKITDFGIAKAVTSTTIVDSSNENIMGSVHYFSPEQAKGGNVDAKSDIYSLGIVLFEMLTGKVPFDGDNPVTVALMQINENIIAPSVLNHNIPPALEEVVLKATEKNPAKRYETADQMIEALNRVDIVSNIVGDTVFAGNENYRADEDDDYGRDYVMDKGSREERRKSSRKSKGGKSAKASKSSKSSKGGRKKVAVAAGIGVILVMIAGIALATGIFEKKDIKVPDFRGMTIEQAEEEAEKLEIEVKIDEYEFSDEYEQDEIMSQDPEEGTMVAKGDVVNVNISKGAESGLVPDLLGKSREDAERMIEEYGFKVGTVKEKEGSEEAGTVLEQDPEPGTELNQNGTINLVVSDGKAKEMVEVPNLLGMSLEAARRALENHGFVLGDVSEGVSTTYGEGEVMWQEYNAGTKLEKGEAVSIRISKGKTTKIAVEVPFSEAENEVFYMSVAITDDNGTRISPKQECHKSDKSKTIYIEGTGRGTMKVYFDDKEVMSMKVDFTTGSVGE